MHLADRCGKGELSVTGGHTTHTQPHTAARSQRARLPHTHTHTAGRRERDQGSLCRSLHTLPPSCPPSPSPPSHTSSARSTGSFGQNDISADTSTDTLPLQKTRGPRRPSGQKILRRPGIEPGFERVCMPLIRCALRLADLVLATPNSTFKLSTSCYRFR